MKKSKILMPILGVGAVAATVAPMVAMTSCNKDEGVVFTAGEVELNKTSGIVASFEITWKEFKGKDKETRSVKTFNVDAEKCSYTTNIESEPIQDFVATVEDLTTFPKTGKATALLAWTNPALTGVGQWIKAKLVFNYIIVDGTAEQKGTATLNVNIEWK